MAICISNDHSTDNSSLRKIKYFGTNIMIELQLFYWRQSYYKIHLTVTKS